MTGASDYEAILRDLDRRGRWRRRAGRGCGLILLVAVLGASLIKAKVAPRDFWRHLPKLGEWLARFWPPDFTELHSSFLPALWETLAIAISGTALAVVVALPLSVCVARNTAPSPWLAVPLRALLNVLRAIDAAIFALLFVAVVGLGPFAGVLGVALHTTGSMAKLFVETLESVPTETREAVEATGAGRLRTFAFAVLPEALPGLVAIALYLWEYNVRASVILGVVGAGGIGYELMVSIKLFDFSRLSAILLIVLTAVVLIDAASIWLRRALR
ncbi:phosphonate ABC transporter, permease protein PhnE [bacterium]|nr:phosphonate ABC transporter, permease protein PhnE [bacterium]